MNLDEYNSLPQRTPDVKPMMSVELIGGPDRTLLYGYTIDRTSFHVYLKDGEIHVHEFTSQGTVEHTAAPEWPSEELIPEKRAYPHATDVRFARILLDQGLSIPWTTFAPERADWTGFYKPPAD